MFICFLERLNPLFFLSILSLVNYAAYLLILPYPASRLLTQLIGSINPIGYKSYLHEKITLP